MTKKMTIVFVILLISMGSAFANELELGFGLAPMEVDSQGGEGDMWDDSLKALHVGYNFGWIFLASLDTFILPPQMVLDMSDGIIAGRPGMVNLYDIGVRLRLGPLMTFAQIGTNTLYIYRQSELVEEYGYDMGGNFGANIRIGAGLRFGWWGFTGSLTSVQNSFSDVTSILKRIASSDDNEREAAIDKMLSTALPSISFMIYF
jgi:hypothetical protein